MPHERPALVPELYVSDLARSLAFYVDLLGFRVEYERPEERFAALHLGGAWIMLEQAGSLAAATPEEFAAGQWRTAALQPPFGRGIHFEIEVAGIEAIASRVSARGWPLLRELHDRAYRVADEPRLVRQLLLADPDGYLVRLSQPLCFEPSPGKLDPQDVLASCIERGAECVLLDEQTLPAEFFDLRSGLAGELLHKLDLYRIRLAGVVRDPSAHPTRFQEFLRETNRGKQFRFFASRRDALEWLGS